MLYGRLVSLGLLFQVACICLCIHILTFDLSLQMVWGTKDDMEFILTLCEQFDYKIQLTSLTGVMRYLATLHDLQTNGEIHFHFTL